MRYFCIVVFLFSLTAEAKKALPIVRVVVPSSLGEPLLLNTKTPTHPRGLVIDYIKLLAKKLKHQAEFTLMPKYRIDNYVVRGLMDFNCYTNPQWVPRPQVFHWSKPLFTKKDIIITMKPAPTALSGFKGETVGTVLGYRYPNLIPFFSNKTMIREDATAEESNLLKIFTGRLNYAVIDNLYVDYYLKQHPQKDLTIRKIPVEEYDIMCALSKSSKITAESMNRAVQELTESQELQNLFAKYR